MRGRFALDDALDCMDMLAFAAAQFMVGAIALRKESVHRNVIFRRTRGSDRRDKVNAVFLFDASERCDFKTTLPALFNTGCLAIGYRINPVPHAIFYRFHVLHCSYKNAT